MWSSPESIHSIYFSKCFPCTHNDLSPHIKLYIASCIKWFPSVGYCSFFKQLIATSSKSQRLNSQNLNSCLFLNIKFQINKQNTQNAMWIIDCRNAFCLQTVVKSIKRSHTQTHEYTQSSCVMCLVLLALSRFLLIECKFKMQLMRNGKLIFLVMLLLLEETASSIDFDSSFYVSRLFVFNAPVFACYLWRYK